MKKIRFDAAYPDGLVEQDGFEFECAGRQLVVHECHPYYRHLADKSERWLVSDKETGFGFGWVRAPTITEAVQIAERIASNLTAEQIAEAVRKGLRMRPKNRQEVAA